MERIDEQQHGPRVQEVRTTIDKNCVGLCGRDGLDPCSARWVMSSCNSLSFASMVLRNNPSDVVSQTKNLFAWSGSRRQGKCPSAADYVCQCATMIIVDTRWTS